MPLPSPTDRPIPSGLYVVATPIGNLEDVTLRALRILSGVDLIAAEDTRHTARLLTHFQIRTPMVSCHEHNEEQRTLELVEKIRSGGTVALVSDAGTPSVSDPGYRLVGAAVTAGLDVFPIPGASAAVAALCASGLPTDAFVFLGFAPKKKGQRMALLESMRTEPRTLVFYESPRRVAKLIEEMHAVMGDRPAVLARELTKLHEEFLRGTLAEIQSNLANRSAVKGECTLLVRGDAGKTVSDAQLTEILQEAFSQPDAHLSSLVKSVSGQHNLPRKRVYDLALKLYNGSKG